MPRVPRGAVRAPTGRRLPADGVAARLEDLGDELPHDGLVLDEQDRLGADARRGGGPRTCGTLGALRRRAAARSGTTSPCPGARVDLDRAAALLDDAVDGREAEAGAAFLRREERLEELLALAPRSCRCRCRVSAQRRRARRSSVTTFSGLDRQRAAVRHRVARVDGEVDDHLLDLRRVGAAPSRARARASITSSTSSPIRRRSICPCRRRPRSGRATRGCSTCRRLNASSWPVSAAARCRGAA